MVVVRPVEMDDVDALEALAQASLQGAYAIPVARQEIEQAVVTSLASFTSTVAAPGPESYCLVLAESADRSIVGTATISATAGVAGTFLAFRKDVIHQISYDLDISHSVEALTLSPGLTADSQLSGFFLLASCHAPHAASLLSRARLLLATLAPQRFGSHFFSSMAGVLDADGRSPFWDGLGRKFFRMELAEAEQRTDGARDQTRMAGLLPHYPVYLPLLDPAAHAAIGQLHARDECAAKVLDEEGFARYDLIDIFDGGPVLRAHRDDLHCFTSAVIGCVATATGETGGVAAYMIGNRRPERFRAVVLDCAALAPGASVHMPASVMACLEVTPGDLVSCVRI